MRDLWEIFEECVWSYALGKVVSVVSGASLIWSVVILISPGVNDHLPQSLHIDSRVWYGLTILLLLILIYLLLKGTLGYKRELEGSDKIRLVYDDEFYPACRETIRQKEIIRIGIRVRGIFPLENPIVLPIRFVRIDTKLRTVDIPIIQSPLEPMVSMDKVHPGKTPQFYVNLFSHEINSASIEFCYNALQGRPMKLSPGRYALQLSARGIPYDIETRILMFTISRNKIVEIAWRREVER